MADKDKIPFGGRDWNKDGKYDNFDRMTDFYVYKKVTEDWEKNGAWDKPKKPQNQYPDVEKSEEDEFFEIMTTPEDFSNVLESIKQNNINILNTDIQMIPSTYVNLTEEDDIKKMTKLLDLLLQDDDVKNVYHNWQE